MIQRVQTIYLLLVAIIQGLFLSMDIYQAQSTTPEGKHIVQILDMVTVSVETPTEGTTSGWWDTLCTAILGADILVVILAVVCIFMFRNRPRQLMLTRLTLLILIVMIGMLFYLIFALRGTLPVGMTERFEPGAYISVISIIFLALAARGIRKDEILVRSADRLR